MGRPMDLEDESSTELLARKIRKHVVNMTQRGHSSHVGSALSIVDILSVLYGSVMFYKSSDPSEPERDRFILSKGHAGAAAYAVLAEVGFFSTDLLKTHYQNGSDLSGHISHKRIPGVELSTGSLGMGLGVACGMAFSAKKKKNNYKVYCLLSDGELDEGSNWEAFLFAAHHNLNNLTAIIDYNKLQSLTTNEETLGLEPLALKLESFGWNVIEVDGHDHRLLKEAFQAPKRSMSPNLVICHTVKGKGVSFMENSVLWHYRSPQGEEYLDALSQLDDASYEG